MLVGHKKQWELFKKMAESESSPHAFLFSGQSQIGKKKIATEFIKLLNCSSEKKPCQTCRNCQDIEKKAHPDFALIEPPEPGKDIQIAQIRDLIWKLSLYPYSAKFKTAIIDQAHLMTREAQNCFLKTLEEPKGNALLILLTEHPEMILPTIRSRSQIVKFSPVRRQEIEKYLLNRGVPIKEVEKIVELSEGKPGMAIDFSLNPEKMKRKENLISDIKKISSSDFSFRFKYAKKLVGEISETPETLKEILDVWTEFFRGILFSKLGGDSSSSYSLKKLREILSLIQSTNYSVSNTNVNPKLALEILLMEI